MTKQEAINIKDEILRKEGSVKLGNITIRDVVQIQDVFNIIDKRIEESESKRYMELAKSYVQGLQAGFAESEEINENNTSTR